MQGNESIIEANYDLSVEHRKKQVLQKYDIQLPFRRTYFSHGVVNSVSWCNYNRHLWQTICWPRESLRVDANVECTQSMERMH